MFSFQIKDTVFGVVESSQIVIVFRSSTNRSLYDYRWSAHVVPRRGFPLVITDGCIIYSRNTLVCYACARTLFPWEMRYFGTFSRILVFYGFKSPRSHGTAFNFKNLHCKMLLNKSCVLGLFASRILIPVFFLIGLGNFLLLATSLTDEPL